MFAMSSVTRASMEDQNVELPRQALAVLVLGLLLVAEVCAQG